MKIKKDLLLFTLLFAIAAVTAHSANAGIAIGTGKSGSIEVKKINEVNADYFLDQEWRANTAVESVIVPFKEITGRFLVENFIDITQLGLADEARQQISDSLNSYILHYTALGGEQQLQPKPEELFRVYPLRGEGDNVFDYYFYCLSEESDKLAIFFLIHKPSETNDNSVTYRIGCYFTRKSELQDWTGSYAPALSERVENFGKNNPAPALPEQVEDDIEVKSPSSPATATIEETTATDLEIHDLIAKENANFYWWVLYYYKSSNTEDFKKKLNIRNAAGKTPLIAAIAADRNDFAEILLNYDEMDVDHSDRNGATPLMHAARACNYDMVRLLIANGANIYAQDDAGQTVLHYLAMGAHSLRQYLRTVRYIDEQLAEEVSIDYDIARSHFDDRTMGEDPFAFLYNVRDDQGRLASDYSLLSQVRERLDRYKESRQ